MKFLFILAICIFTNVSSLEAAQHLMATSEMDVISPKSCEELTNQTTGTTALYRQIINKFQNVGEYMSQSTNVCQVDATGMNHLTFYMLIIGDTQNARFKKILELVRVTPFENTQHILRTPTKVIGYKTASTVKNNMYIYRTPTAKEVYANGIDGALDEIRSMQYAFDHDTGVAFTKLDNIFGNQIGIELETSWVEHPGSAVFYHVFPSFELGVYVRI